MNHTQEIVIDSDDNEDKFSDVEECCPEQENPQFDTTEYQIEVVEKLWVNSLYHTNGIRETMEIEERLPNRSKTLLIMPF